MKKENLKLLKLNKKTISVLKLYRIKGGTNETTQTLADPTDGFAETNRCGG